MRNGGPSKGTEQAGFASLVIAIVLVLVLSLTTVGFAQLMRKEQRAAIDNHLSSQAFYAAEAGVNDGKKALNMGFDQQKKNCEGWDTYKAPVPGSEYLKHVNRLLGDGDDVAYTCLLIDPAPKTLEYGSVGGENGSIGDGLSSRVFQISGRNPNDATQPALIKQIVISWEKEENPQDFAPATQTTFPPALPATNWPHVGLLRISLTPLASGFISRDALMEANYTAFLYPNTFGSVTMPTGDPVDATGPSAPFSSYIGYRGAYGGGIVNGKCNTGNKPLSCNVIINDLGQTNYLVDLRSLYRSSRVTVTAWGYDDKQLRIQNAQTMIDATGRAQDVLRRIQVRVASKNTFVYSDYAMETGDDICKRLELTGEAASSFNHCNTLIAIPPVINP